MPKISDSQCPLGFHPQFRRPNYCKRCFREYNDHKLVREGSTSSINSASYDRRDYYGSRESLKFKEENKYSPTRVSALKADSEENKRRPLSWSSQDLRQTSEEAIPRPKTLISDSSFGSTRSLTQDLGELTRILNAYSNTSSNSVSKNSDSESYDKTSYSSYLSSRTKSPLRSYVRSYSETRSEKLPPIIEKETSTNQNIEDSSSRHTPSPKIENKPTPAVLEKTSPAPASKNENSKLCSQERSPRSHIKNIFVKQKSTSELPASEYETKKESKKFIQSLQEVKSTDADASYILKIRPKKAKSNTENSKIAEIPKTTKVDSNFSKESKLLENKTKEKKINIDEKEKVKESEKSKDNSKDLIGLKKENEALKNQAQESAKKLEHYEAQIKDLNSKKSVIGDFRKQSEVSHLQSKVDTLSDEVKKKNKEIATIKKELERKPSNKNSEKATEELKSKLQIAEKLYEELMDENENQKKEIKILENEVEELQDNFREEQADEYRDLKRELEQRAKDCRILHFKLKKAERRSENLEKDKVEVEEKLKELQLGDDDYGRAERINSMEKELVVARDVSLKMHEEMERMKEQLKLAETDTIKLREKVQEAPIKPGIKISRSQVIGRQGSQENKEDLLSDLNDAIEREQDMKEQLKFAEEETKNLRKKLSRIEEENETLQLQLNKMSSKAKRQRSLERTGSNERANSVERGTLSRQGSTEKPPPILNGDDLDPTDMKIQLELNEQESAILRRKVENLESENLRLQKELREILTSEYKRIEADATKNSPQNRRKLDLLQDQIVQHQNLIEALKSENEKLQKDMNDKSSLEVAHDVNKTDDAREIQKLQKQIFQLEEQNDDLKDENKRISLKIDKKFPLKIPENLYIEKQALEDKLKRMDRRLKDAQDKLRLSAFNASFGSEKNPERQASIAGQTESTKIPKENKNIDIAYVDRIPKKPKDITPKLTLIKWVNELEQECVDLHSALRQQVCSSPNAQVNKSSASDIYELRNEKEKNKEMIKQMSDISLQKKNQDAETEKLKIELKNANQRIERLQNETNDESLVSKENFNTLQDENKKLRKELLSTQQSSKMAAAKSKEALEALGISENGERNLKNLLEKAETRESNLRIENLRLKESESKYRSDKEELKKIRHELQDSKCLVFELNEKVIKVKKEKESDELKQEKRINQITSEKDTLKIRTQTLESELQREKRKTERLDHDLLQGNKTANEVEIIQQKLDKVENDKNEQRLHFIKLQEDFEKKKKDLEDKLEEEKFAYNEMHQKYYELKEDYSNLQELDLNNDSSTSTSTEYKTLEQELKTLRETYVSHQDSWIKEKLNLQMDLKTAQNKLKENRETVISASEKLKLKNIIVDKNEQLETLRSERDVLNDQVASLRREIEDLRNKLEDLEKLQNRAEKHQTSASVDLKPYEATIKELRSRFTSLEKLHKSESTKVKMRYDSKIRAMNEELTTTGQQMSRYRRERDTYKEMLDGAQKSIADLKGNGFNSLPCSRADNLSEVKAHLNERHELESTITELEDKLSDSKLENSKLKNEFMDMKTNFEIKINEMRTKLNEYEEDRLLGTGSRRVPGLRTRLELNWQKEREEQQRLIQDTATLSKDLRKTLFEVERERDLERIESKRKIDQLKQMVNQDQTDAKYKVQELQRDLQELRETHAKLRQINEKLRRDKDRSEIEREVMRSKFLGSSREQLNQQVKLDAIADQLENLKELVPTVTGISLHDIDQFKSKLGDTLNSNTKDEFLACFTKLSKSVNGLRFMLQMGDDDKMRRPFSFQRGSSIESDDSAAPSRPQSAVDRGRNMRRNFMPTETRTLLHRKAQSLDHQLADSKGKIWLSTEAGSTTSVESSSNLRPNNSSDRLSASSQTSDLDLNEGSGKHSKGGLKGVLSRIGRAKSIEETKTAEVIADTGLKVISPTLNSSSNTTTNMSVESTTLPRTKNKFLSKFKKNQSGEPAADTPELASQAILKPKYKTNLFR